jgi:urease gamma subunit
MVPGFQSSSLVMHESYLNGTQLVTVHDPIQ